MEPSRSTTARTPAVPVGRDRGGASRWRATRKRRAVARSTYRTSSGSYSWAIGSMVGNGCVRDRQVLSPCGPNGHLPYTRPRTMASTRDYYDILGVPRSASDDDLKRAFRRLAQQWHPDVSTEPGADERFKEINEAYQVLSDPQRRQAYDTFGHAGVGGGAEGFGPFGGFAGFGDIFDAFFGGATTGTQRRTRAVTGADLRYDLQLTFDEAIKGTIKDVTFTALGTCETCGGSGAEPGSSPITCPQCSGTGEIRQVRSTMLGQMVNVT